jgi:hypothetical protein
MPQNGCLHLDAGEVSSMTLIKFVRNHKDLSADRGCRFEFFCGRCGSGCQSIFRGSASGTLTDALDAASGLLGSIFGNVADAGHKVHSASWERRHDQEFQKAIEEVKKRSLTRLSSAPARIAVQALRPTPSFAANVVSRLNASAFVPNVVQR